MKITMTIGGVDCNVKVLSNELTCRIAKGRVIPQEGLPVEVGDSPTFNPSDFVTR